MNTATIDKPARTSMSKNKPAARREPASPGLNAKMTLATSRREPLLAGRTHHLIALVDVGFGNTVHVRGEGASLSWDTGVPMCCLGDNRWVFAYSAEDPPRMFKFLRNDTDWALGENQSTGGKAVSVHIPQFPPG